MSKRLPATLSLVAASCSLALSAAVDAAPVAKTFYLDPALSCQLSIPTTDSAIRPRATGMRNEGGVPTFVICGLPYLVSGTEATSYTLEAVSFDGAEHTFSCTGTTRYSTGASPAFSVKSITTPASGAGASVQWTDADTELGNLDASITCALPSGAAITSVQMVVSDEIGL
jgi:hypothetical protein